MDSKPPRLMLLPELRLSDQGYRNVHATLDAWFADPTHGLVFDFPCVIYQLVEGKWIPLHPPTADPNPDPSLGLVVGAQ